MLEAENREGTQGGTTKRERGVGNDGLQETSQAPLSSVMRKHGERGLFDKCEMYHSSLLWSRQSTIYGVFFELPG